MWEFLMIFLIFIILFVFIALLILIQEKRKREKAKNGIDNEIKGFGGDLIKQIKEFLNKPTTITFIIITFNSGNYFDTIIQDNKEYILKNMKEMNFNLI